MTKLTAIRVVTAHTARRMVRIATFIVLGIFAVLLLLIVVLVYFFSSWWWLLLVPIMFALGIVLALRFILLLIVNRIHDGKLNPSQRQAVDSFVDKLEQLIEARGTPPIVFALISIKDLLIHRDLTTIKKIIKDSAGLQRDFIKLQQLF